MALCRFLENGLLLHTIREYAEDELKTYLQEGYHEVTSEDLELYETLQYLRDPATGKPILEVIPEVPLEDVKAQKKYELKYERDKREVAVIAYKGKQFDYDDKARERLNIARQALEDNNLPSQMWTCADNTDIELTVEDFKNINSLAAQRSGQLHDTYRKLCDYIDKLKTADEVNAVTFDTEVIQ